MSFVRSLLILCAVFLIAGAACIFVGLLRDPHRNHNAYAALITSETVPDREIRRLIGDTLISESSQWVFLDDFGGLARIPLDEYTGRLLPIDPRNDGYADKLRSFFVRNGKRFSFIPLEGNASGALEKRLASLLGEIPFSLEYIGVGAPVGVFFVIFGAAAALLFFFRFLPVRPRIETADLVFCLPVLGFLVVYGPPGFALCSLLAGLAALTREPLREFCMFLRQKNGGMPVKSETRKAIFRRDIYEPFRINWLVAFFFIAAFVFVAAVTAISLPVALGILLLFAGLFGLSVKTFALPRDSQAHIRFSPVLITKSSLKPVFAAVMLPFAAAACAAGLCASMMPGSPDSSLLSLQGELVTEDEYRAHAAYQASFSFTSLGSGSGGGYRLYTRAGDGLIDPAETVPGPVPDAPPFPLKDLMNFLASVIGAGG